MRIKNLLFIIALCLFEACTQNKGSDRSTGSMAYVESDSGNQVYEFINGFPAEATARRVNDETTLSRAIMAYRFFYPTVSMEGTMEGTLEARRF